MNGGLSIPDCMGAAAPILIPYGKQHCENTVAKNKLRQGIALLPTWC